VVLRFYLRLLFIKTAVTLPQDSIQSMKLYFNLSDDINMFDVTEVGEGNIRLIQLNILKYKIIYPHCPNKYFINIQSRTLFLTTVHILRGI